MGWWRSGVAFDADRRPVFEEIITALVAAGVRFVVIGGVAAAVQGSARLTNDLDLCYDAAPDNLDALTARLRNWHASLRGVEPGLPFVLDARALRSSPVLTLTTDVGDIDIFDRVAGVGGYTDAVSASEKARIGRTGFRTLTLRALIASKKAVGRPRDHEHLIELGALLALRRKSSS